MRLVIAPRCEVCLDADEGGVENEGRAYASVETAAKHEPLCQVHAPNCPKLHLHTCHGGKVPNAASELRALLRGQRHNGVPSLPFGRGYRGTGCLLASPLCVDIVLGVPDSLRLLPDVVDVQKRIVLGEPRLRGARGAACHRAPPAASEILGLRPSLHTEGHLPGAWHRAFFFVDVARQAVELLVGDGGVHGLRPDAPQECGGAVRVGPRRQRLVLRLGRKPQPLRKSTLLRRVRCSALVHAP
mmetsp:Transcript_47611/g.136964  ORF Transcript_47611/g.136964 Transcript_47611/m.136964 type:complete len:243 (-) Transcript_47611:416-1144(-)